ncbi:MAG: arylsulfatase [Proteobacteria bacterium]|nr:arylsulfatase [Pseudomonadota bacterium]MDA0993243.1 arylsulfatase [Pseudomonadota bacterium]
MIQKQLFIICLVVACSSPCFAAAESGRPNILLIVADDLGYADLGVYGSEIETPNIDALAAGGMLFTQFHTAPMCAPSRAMLLSGNNNGIAGVASQNRFGLLGAPFPGYEGSLSDRIVPLPRLLTSAGYDTYMVGKWHLGFEPDQSPYAAGFKRSFSVLAGGGTHFDSLGFYEGGALYREDQDLADYPDGRYSTDFYTDKLIEYIDKDRQDGRPFFAYAAYTSPHWPLQVPDDYLTLYKGYYDDGYDALRERRFDSLKEAGIIPADSELPPRNNAITPWADLTAEQKRSESRKMELYAAMLDNLDDHVGRLIRYLKENDLYGNTLIVFIGDNGAAAEDYYNEVPDAAYTPYLRRHFDNSFEKMGTAASFVSYGAQWAEAGSAPFQRHKGYLREGGIVAPMIISGAGVSESAVIDSNYVTVMDLAPTFLAYAGGSYPDDGKVMPMLGESMVDLLGGETDAVHDDNYVTVMSHRGRALLRQGRWKIVTMDGPFDESKFELFDVVADPGETNNLTGAEPEKLAEMIGIWRVERKKLGIVLPEDL